MRTFGACTACSGTFRLLGYFEVVCNFLSIAGDSAGGVLGLIHRGRKGRSSSHIVQGAQSTC